MNSISVLETNITALQEKILIEFDKLLNINDISKTLGIKHITLSKSIQALREKKLLENFQLTESGKKMVHYLKFKNETILLIIQKLGLESSEETINELSKLNYKIILAIRNIL